MGRGTSLRIVDKLDYAEFINAVKCLDNLEAQAWVDPYELHLAIGEVDAAQYDYEVMQYWGKRDCSDVIQLFTKYGDVVSDCDLVITESIMDDILTRDIQNILVPSVLKKMRGIINSGNLLIFNTN